MNWLMNTHRDVLCVGLSLLGVVTVVPAFAQQRPDMQQSIDAAQAQATTIISNFRQQIIADQNQIAALTAENAKIAKERDDLKVKVQEVPK